MANEPNRNAEQNQQGHEGGGSNMPGRNPRDDQDLAGKREGAGAQGDATDRAEVDRPDLNNQDVE
ncbi:MAG TPA: hypothetical protein VJT15_11865 [Pyrinomonadaceae bacterium]|nr:hypothetical protein [Pyrinomonadaceae bacterium]